MGKIPPQAKRVFEGVIFDVYHWDQLLYDGKTTATFEMLKRNDTVVILAAQNDKILLARDEQPHRPIVTTLIAGRVDDGEDVLAAAKRELVEESGYAAQDWSAWKTFEPSHKIDWTTHFFIARDLERVAEPDPSAGERVTTEWVTFDEFLARTRQPDFQNHELALELYRMDSAALDAFRAQLGV